MLAKEYRQYVDKAWNLIWSGGITNPIVVSDLLGTVLMIGGSANVEAWYSLEKSAEQSDSTSVARSLSAIRRDHGIDAGAEIEGADFWRDCGILSRAMQALDPVVHATDNTDVLGDIYEHVLSKLSLAGHFGQFRTPRHLVEFMVELVAPADGETVVDPACGSAGFLVAASNYRKRKDLGGAYEGIEIDRTVARIASANVVFHGISNASIHLGDGLTDEMSGQADVILANPPFSGAVSTEVAAGFNAGTKKTELLFLESMVERLRSGGRAAVVVPLGVLTGSSTAPRWIRELLVKGNQLRSVIELPSGVFRPYTDVKTAILFWESRPPTDPTFMIRVDNDGFSLDQRRVPIAANDLPGVIDLHTEGNSDVAWISVTLADIASQRFNLNPSRYLETRAAEETGVPESSAAEALESIRSSAQKISDKIAKMQELVAR